MDSNVVQKWQTLAKIGDWRPIGGNFSREDDDQPCQRTN